MRSLQDLWHEIGGWGFVAYLVLTGCLLALIEPEYRNLVGGTALALWVLARA